MAPLLALSPARRCVGVLDARVACVAPLAEGEGAEEIVICCFACDFLRLAYSPLSDTVLSLSVILYFTVILTLFLAFFVNSSHIIAMRKPVHNNGNTLCIHDSVR